MLWSYGPFEMYRPFSAKNSAVGDIRTPAYFTGPAASSLGEVLIRHRNKKATDPRDKVYSILGLISPEKLERFRIDYDLDAAKVFTYAATFTITEENNLSVLAENKTPPDYDSDASECILLPSWVPNYAHANLSNRRRIDRLGPWVKAAGESTPEATIHDGRVLAVRGIRVGTVTKVGPAMPNFEDGEYTFGPIFVVMHAWWLLYRSSAHYTDSDLMTGFLDLMLLGMFKTFPPAALPQIYAAIMMDIRIVADVYVPEDTTLTPLLPKSEGEVGDARRRQAEQDIWGPAPVTVTRKFVVVDGYMCGIGSQCVEEGDLVVVVLGCKVPLVFRPRSEEEGGGFLNMGDSYIPAVMDGSVVKDVEDGKRVSEVFYIH